MKPTFISFNVHNGKGFKYNFYILTAEDLLKMPIEMFKSSNLFNDEICLAGGQGNEINEDVINFLKELTAVSDKQIATIKEAYFTVVTEVEKSFVDLIEMNSLQFLN